MAIKFAKVVGLTVHGYRAHIASFFPIGAICQP